MTNQITISRKKIEQKPNPLINLSISETVINKTEDFNNFVVMSGTAKRKPLEKKENRTAKTNFRESFSKLRAPFCKTSHKHAQTEEKVMTKSCQILFECIKPYKDIRVTRKTQTKEYNGTIGSILTTDIVYERKATRKVQFFSFSEENPLQTSLPNKTSQVLTADFDIENFLWGANELIPEGVANFRKSGALPITASNVLTTPNETGKTVSSEDFITNAFPDPTSN